eukprot:12047009-Heterocapsa_arctica.AAC.1
MVTPSLRRRRLVAAPPAPPRRRSRPQGVRHPAEAVQPAAHSRCWDSAASRASGWQGVPAQDLQDETFSAVSGAAGAVRPPTLLVRQRQNPMSAANSSIHASDQ